MKKALWIVGGLIGLLIVVAVAAPFFIDLNSYKGMIAAGYLADLVMLDRDLFAIAPEDIRNARVVMTLVGGKTVFEQTP